MQENRFSVARTSHRDRNSRRGNAAIRQADDRRRLHRTPRTRRERHCMMQTTKRKSLLVPMLRKEFIQMRRDRLTFALMIGIPIIQLILFGYAIRTEVRNLPTVVLDESKIG